MAEVISEVQRIVTDLHTGKLHCDIKAGTKPITIRRTPSFLPAPRTYHGKRYTAVWIATVMEEEIDSGFCGGKTRKFKASPRVTTALNLLEAEERGKIELVPDSALLQRPYSTNLLKDFTDIILERPRSKTREDLR